MRICTGEEEYQGLDGWKGENDWEESFTTTGLVGVIKRSGSELISRRPGTGWVGASDILGGASDRGVNVADRAIGYQGIGEQVISERANLGMSDREVTKRKNTQ